jgi:hypothetical protein
MVVILDEMKNRKYHTIRTFREMVLEYVYFNQNNSKIQSENRRNGKIDIFSIHIHDHSLFCLGTGTLIRCFLYIYS